MGGDLPAAVPPKAGGLLTGGGLPAGENHPNLPIRRRKIVTPPQSWANSFSHVVAGISANQKRRKVFTVFVELLQDPDRDVRLASAQSLGRLGDPRAASSLMTAMSDADEGVRHAAAEAVEFLNFLGAA